MKAILNKNIKRTKMSSKDIAAQKKKIKINYFNFVAKHDVNKKGLKEFCEKYVVVLNKLSKIANLDTKSEDWILKNDDDFKKFVSLKGEHDNLERQYKLQKGFAEDGQPVSFVELAVVLKERGALASLNNAFSTKTETFTKIVQVIDMFQQRKLINTKLGGLPIKLKVFREYGADKIERAIINSKPSIYKKTISSAEIKGLKLEQVKSIFTNIYKITQECHSYGGSSERIGSLIANFTIAAAYLDGREGSVEMRNLIFPFTTNVMLSACDLLEDVTGGSFAAVDTVRKFCHNSMKKLNIKGEYVVNEQKSRDEVAMKLYKATKNKSVDTKRLKEFSIKLAKLAQNMVSLQSFHGYAKWGGDDFVAADDLDNRVKITKEKSDKLTQELNSKGVKAEYSGKNPSVEEAKKYINELNSKYKSYKKQFSEIIGADAAGIFSMGDFLTLLQSDSSHKSEHFESGTLLNELIQAIDKRNNYHGVNVLGYNVCYGGKRKDLEEYVLAQVKNNFKVSINVTPKKTTINASSEVGSVSFADIPELSELVSHAIIKIDKRKKAEEIINNIKVYVNERGKVNLDFLGHIMGDLISLDMLHKLDKDIFIEIKLEDEDKLKLKQLYNELNKFDLFAGTFSAAECLQPLFAGLKNHADKLKEDADRVKESAVLL